MAVARHHLVLLGDSTIDNRAYIRRDEPDVAEQVAAALPQWRVTSLAQDGAVIEDTIHRQLPRLPADATHLAVSVGGNDLLRVAHVLHEPAATVTSGLLALSEAFQPVLDDYYSLLQRLRLPTICCLVYRPQFGGDFGAAADMALAISHDDTRTLIRWARQHLPGCRSIQTLDLRHILSQQGDYANAIEPSARGGAKIAASLAAIVNAFDLAARTREPVS